MQLVIIGGDAAGMSAASQAKRLDKEAEVIVLEQTQDVSYGACGMPYKLPDGQDMDDLKIITAERFRNERGIDVRLGCRVTRISRGERVVAGEGPDGAFELRYDKLIIATGARVSRPPIPGLDALWGRGAYPLKTLGDGRALKAALGNRPETAAIIGGGYIGLETSEGLREQGLDVTIIEALPELLPFLPQTMRERIYAEATEHGVRIERGVRVESLQRSDAGGPIAIRTSAGEIVVDLVVAATGVRPNAELAADAGLALGAAGSVRVDASLHTSDPSILAAGDCADAIHALTGASTWIPLALRANRSGKLAGANALAPSEAQQTAPPVIGTAVFKFFGLQVARTGLSAEEADAAGLQVVSAQIESSTRAHYFGGGGKLSVWLLAEQKSGRLLGGAMVGPEAAAHKIDTVAAALHAGLDVKQLYDMDLAYAPPFGPSWSPLLTCASQLLKKVR